MHVGMLWFDNDTKSSLPEKVKRAADYYRRKYGEVPDLCLVNPAMLEKGNVEGTEVKVETAADIQPNHFWVGRRGV